MKTGDLAYVIDCNGHTLERVVVRACGNLVFVCTGEEWGNSQAEGWEPVTVGWPLEAVIGGPATAPVMLPPGSQAASPKRQAGVRVTGSPCRPRSLP